MCLVFIVHPSGDADSDLFVSGGELALFLLCTLLVTQTVTCLVSEGELAWFLLYTLLLTLPFLF